MSKMTSWISRNCRFAADDQAAGLAVTPEALGKALEIQVRNVIQGLAGPEMASDPQVMEDTSTVMASIGPSIMAAARPLSNAINKALQTIHDQRAQTQVNNTTTPTNTGDVSSEAPVSGQQAPAAPIPGM